MGWAARANPQSREAGQTWKPAPEVKSDRDAEMRLINRHLIEFFGLKPKKPEAK